MPREREWERPDEFRGAGHATCRRPGTRLGGRCAPPTVRCWHTPFTNAEVEIVPDSAFGPSPAEPTGRPGEDVRVPSGGDAGKYPVYTVGHSTRTIEEFIRLMKTYDIEVIVDVRKIAKSRHNTQYNEAALAETLTEHGISYLRIERLGGLRHTTKSSINTAWENLSFRGYADYMQTSEFANGIQQLTRIAEEKRTAIMCAEVVPWRCHRSLIGDALVIRNIPVEDIMSERSSKPHTLTSFARVVDGAITYPGKA